MKKNIVVTIFILFISCKEKEVYFDESDIVVPKEYRLQVEGVENFLNKELSPIRDIIQKDSLLIVNRIFPNPYYFSIYHLSSGNKLTDFGVHGLGPGELPDYSNVNLSDSSLEKLEIIVPNAGGSIYTLDLKSLKEGNITLDKVAELGYNPSNFANVKSGYVIDFGQRFDLVDIHGKKIESAIHYPFQEETRLPKNLWNLAHQGLMKKRPVDNKIVFATSYAPNIDLMEYDHKLKSLKKTHIRQPKVFNNSGKLASGDGEVLGITVSSENKMGFLDLDVTNDYIYLLYSGRSFDEEGDNSFLGNKVYILDWNINFKGVLLLEKDTRIISIDPLNTTILTLDESQERTAILKYNLPKLN